MTSAHHTVTVSILDSDGAALFGKGDVFSVYCTLDEIGRRTVVKQTRERFAEKGSPLDRCDVTLDCSVGGFAVDATLAAEVAS